MKAPLITFAGVAVVSALSAIGCAGQMTTADIARDRAHEDFHCNRENVAVSHGQRAGDEYVASGCGKQAVYRCAMKARKMGVGSNSDTEYQTECFQE